ncbi:MAG: flagellar assembly protein FliW [Pseudomonadota bacterium]
MDQLIETLPVNTADQDADGVVSATDTVSSVKSTSVNARSGDKMTAAGEQEQPQSDVSTDGPTDALAPEAPIREETEDLIRISTRFGVMEFPKDQALELPHGLLGFAGLTKYGLANIPGTEDSQFKFLQCLDEANLGFLVLPLAGEQTLIAEEHLKGALDEHKIAPADALVMLIVTMRPKLEGGVLLTANLQGPIVVDAVRRMAWQHVMHDGEYAVQHPL